MAKVSSNSDLDVEALGTKVAARFDEVPWRFFNSDDLASSGETRYMVSRIQADLIKVAEVDRTLATQIWNEHVPAYVPRPEGLLEPELEDKPLNGIAPGRTRRKNPTEPYLDTVSAARSEAAENLPSKTSERGRAKSPEQGGPKQGGDDPEAAERDDGRVKLLLDGLSKQYVRAEGKYHFRDKGGAVAFEVQDKKLVTQHDTPSVVSSMIDLAETQEWSSLKLTGTQAFRREAWLQASLRDFQVTGYQPTKLDKAHLEERRTDRGLQAKANTIAELKIAGGSAPPRAAFDATVEPGWVEPKIAPTPAQEQFLQVMEATMRHRGDGPQAIARARELANERLTSARVHVGKLVEAGTGSYQDKPGAKPSHFVALEAVDGVRTKVWGVDLPRALQESGAQLGQTVALAFKGREPVTVDVPIRGAAGRVLRTERRPVDRNNWDIVQIDRLRADAKTSVLAAVDRQNRPPEFNLFDRSAKPAKPAVAPNPEGPSTRARSR